jgi:hypothetical protein
MIANVLLIFQDDFKHQSFLDWLISHVSGSLPPHRYAGKVEISGRFIRFYGTDTLINQNTDLIIRKECILEVFHGYDKVYNVFQTRGLGLNWAPVRLKFQDSDLGERYLYMLTGIEQDEITNAYLYNFLVEWLS